MARKEVSLADRSTMLASSLQGASRRITDHAKRLQGLREQHMQSLPEPLRDMVALIERGLIDEANQLHSGEA